MKRESWSLKRDRARERRERPMRSEIYKGREKREEERPE
jgi:hypothetical protein